MVFLANRAYPEERERLRVLKNIKRACLQIEPINCSKNSLIYTNCWRPSQTILPSLLYDILNVNSLRLLCSRKNTESTLMMKVVLLGVLYLKVNCLFKVSLLCFSINNLKDKADPGRLPLCFSYWTFYKQFDITSLIPIDSNMCFCFISNSGLLAGYIKTINFLKTL